MARAVGAPALRRRLGLSNVGFGVSLMMASSLTLLNFSAFPAIQGGITGLLTFSYLSVGPFGGLFAGWLASRIGLSWTLFACGAGCLASALVFVAQSSRNRASA